MDINIHIKEAMKAKMAAEGMTQAELAEKLNIKQPSIAGILSRSGPRVPPSLIRALDALDLELVVQLKEGRP